MEVMATVVLLPSQDKYNVLSKYKAGMSARALSKLYHVNKESMVRLLKRNNIRIRHQPHYTINHKFFDILDVKSAYWLGFILADGSVSVKKNRAGGTTHRLRIKLKASDSKHIRKFLDDINCNRLVKKCIGIAIGKSHRQARVNIGNKYMVNRLINLGVVQNKTLTATVPKISTHLYKHFWRGFIDGDGWIQPPSRLGLIGNKNIVNSFVQYLHTLGINEYLLRKHHSTSGIFVINLRKDATKIVTTELYQDSNIHLNRKYKRAMLIVNN